MKEHVCRMAQTALIVFDGTGRWRSAAAGQELRCSDPADKPLARRHRGPGARPRGGISGAAAATSRCRAGRHRRADPALQAKYQKKYTLADDLFFKDPAKMIEQRRPQALLVYTSIADHRRVDRNRRVLRRIGDGGKAADHFARRCAGHSQDRARKATFTCW